MPLKCPNCSEFIAAENVNIQKTLAVCSQCDHVFDFSGMVTTRKAKQREVPQPARLSVHEADERLELAYQRVYGPNDKVGVVVCTGMAIFLVFIATMAWNDATAPLLVRLFFTLLAGVFWYLVAVFLTTTTRITVGEESLAIRSGPLPFPFNDGKTLGMADVVEVFCEETEDSKSRAGLDRYYRVCARFSDDNHVALLKDLPQDYAFYIAQALEGYVHVEEDADVIVPGEEFHDDENAVPTEHLLDTENQSKQATS